jgi:hypothetical protein
MSTHVGGRDRDVRNRQLIQGIFLTLLVAVGVIGPVFAAQIEPEVEVFGSTEITLSAVYDAQTGVFFAPELNPKEKESLEVFQDMRKRAGLEAAPFPIMALFDTGVLSHHPLIARALIEAKDFTSEGPEDQVGHGTIVALVHIAQSPPDARIVSVKAIGKSGKGEVSNLLKAIEWVTEKKFRVVNMSLGVYLQCLSIKVYGEQVVNHPRSCERQPICQAASKALNNGVSISAAVGNQPDKIGCPACCKEVGSVGSPAEYSGRGAQFISPGTVRLVPVQ